jgi:hypothetical protein
MLSKVALLAIFGSLSCAIFPSLSHAACNDKGKYLFVSSETLKYSMSVNEGLIRAKFDRCNVVVGGRRDVLRKDFDIGLHVRTRFIYQNLGDFENDLNSGKLQGVVDIVIYNPEPGYINTTPDEKADPVSYAIRFAKLAKENGLLSAAAPSCRLVREKDVLRRFQLCAKQIYRKIAPYYDFIDIQAQSVQSNSVLYRQVVSLASDVIKSVSSETKVIAQLSTVDSIGGGADTMGEAAMAVRDMVDGYWINVDNKSLDGKTDFIELTNKYELK